MLTPSSPSPHEEHSTNIIHDILNIVKQNEVKLTQMYDNVLNNIKQYNKDNEIQFQTLNTSINDINIKIAYCNEIATKVEQLFQFKSNTENVLSTLSIRNDSLSKDIKDAIVKYDKIIQDNLMYPGLIGNDCKYKTFHEFLNYILQHINEFVNYKDSNVTTLAEHKMKLDSVSKSISTRIDAIVSSMKQFTTQSVNDLNESIINKLHSYDERLQEMRIENSKYTVQLKYQTANMLNEWNNVINMKDELISQFKQSNTKINETMRILEQYINEYNKQYKQIKSKFVLVSNMLKNVKNGNDGITKQHLIQISNILNKENDNDINNINGGNKLVQSYKGGINAESFVKKYIKGEVDINTMKYMNHSNDNKREINTMKRGTMFNLLNNKTMVNNLMMKHITKDNNNNNNNSEDNSLTQKENEKIIEDEFNKNNNNNIDLHNDNDKQKTEGTETICIYNSYKEYNQPNIINDYKRRTKRTGNNEDIYYITNNHANKVFDNTNNNINNKQHNTIQIKRNGEDEYDYNENKSTENNNNIISIANKNKITKSNKGNTIQTSHKIYHNTNKQLSYNKDKIDPKLKTRNEKSNSIKYRTLQYPSINFPQINLKLKNKSLSKTSSESSFQVGNNISNEMLSNELTEYLQEIKAHLPKESIDIFSIKSIDKHNKTSRNSFRIQKQISPSLKTILSNSMNQTLNDKNKDMKNNYYYNLMMNDDNNLNVNYTNRGGKGNTRSHKTIFKKLLNNKPKYVLNAKPSHKPNDLLNV